MSGGPATSGAESTRLATLGAVAEWLVDPAFADGASEWELIEQVRQLERVKSACAAAQAVVTAAFAAMREATMTPEQLRDATVRRGVNTEIAAARRDGPFDGSRHVGVAKALTAEMPHTLQALRAGEISERRAALVVRETATLSLEHRQIVDAELAGRLGSMGDAKVEHATRQIAQRLDQQQALDEHRLAVSQRRVTVRSAADNMCYLTALVPVVDGVAAYAALNKSADSAKLLVDDRSRGQLMADELAIRVAVVGQTNAGARVAAAADVSDADPIGADLENGAPTESRMPAVASVGGALSIQLLMTDRTLFDGEAEPAILTGFGPIPAPLARRLVRNNGSPSKTWIRRMFTDRETGDLTGMDGRRRLLPDDVRQHLITHDPGLPRKVVRRCTS